jgi:CRP/FNR family transcriptional regulator, cyclic AMP receptor protein
MDMRIARVWADHFLLDANAAVIRALTDKCRLCTLADRDVLIEQGAADSSVFLLIAGSARVVRWSLEGNEIWLSNLQTGAIVGETAALISSPRTSAVIADGPLVAAQMYGDDFLGLLETWPILSLALNRMLARRVKETSDQLVDSLTLEVCDRFYAHLVALSEPAEDGADYRIVRNMPTVTSISQEIHATREATSRAKTRLLGQGDILKQEDGTFVIHKRRRSPV